MRHMRVQGRDHGWRRERLAALNDGTFDLMLVDIFMPHMRGFESIRIFHERAPAIPIVAMSGYAFANLDSPAPDFLRMALELGAARCLRKPFTPGALLALVNECLAEAGSRFSGIVQSNWRLADIPPSPAIDCSTVRCAAHSLPRSASLPRRCR